LRGTWPVAKSTVYARRALSFVRHRTLSHSRAESSAVLRYTCRW
jgi:hypothetical protein